ncbi:MAG: UDPGP type 1 family protein [Planctomycetota bacterium]
MNQSMRALEESLRKAFCDADQGHVFRFWEDLSEGEQRAFLEQLAKVDLDLLRRLLDEHLAPHKEVAPRSIEPAPFIPIPQTEDELARARAAREAGEVLLRAGQVAVVIVAGGQATRLGFEGPKGLYPIGPVSGKCLFEIHAEKIRALVRRYGAPLPLFIMTSASNDAATRDAFKSASYYGLDPGDVYFFEQEMLPAVTRSGHLILAERGRLFMSPDGHGGCLKALRCSGCLDIMRQRHLREIFYCQVDNPLVRIADPVFLGHHVREAAEMSLKVVRKRDPSEKVGVVVVADGKLSVIEYTDLGGELAAALDAAGELRFAAGSIAIHALAVSFAERLTEGGDLRLPFHKALKAIATVDEKGHPKSPDEPNGIKFEAFIFDALPLARKAVIVEVRREDEFSPVKNASGVDSAATCRQDMSRFFARWLEAAGLHVESSAGAIEVSPLFALDEEEFAAKVRHRGLIGRAGLWVF